MPRSVIIIEGDVGKALQALKAVNVSIKQLPQSAVQSTRQMQSATERLQRQFSAVGRSIFNLRNLIAGFAGFYIGRQLIGSIIQAGENMERWELTLATLTNSVDIAREKLAKLIDFAARTPFTTPGVLEAATMLEAFGINSTKFLRQLGDAAAVFGKDITSAAQAVISGIVGQTEVLRRYGIDMRREGDRTYFMWKDRMGRVREITVKTSRDVIAATIAMIFNEKYAGAMERYQNTYRGMVELIRSYFWEFQKDIGVGWMKAIKDLLQRIKETWERWRIEGVIQDTVNTIVSVLTKLTNFVTTTVVPGVIGFMRALWRLRYVLGAVLGAAVIYKIVRNLSTLIQTLQVLRVTALGTATAFLGWAGVIATIAGVGYAIYSAYRHARRFREEIEHRIAPLSLQLLQQEAELAGDRVEQLEQAIQDLRSLMERDVVSSSQEAQKGIHGVTLKLQENIQTFTAVADNLKVVQKTVDETTAYELQHFEALTRLKDVLGATRIEVDKEGKVLIWYGEKVFEGSQALEILKAALQRAREEQEKFREATDTGIQDISEFGAAVRSAYEAIEPDVLEEAAKRLAEFAFEHNIDIDLVQRWGTSIVKSGQDALMLINTLQMLNKQLEDGLITKEQVIQMFQNMGTSIDEATLKLNTFTVTYQKTLQSLQARDLQRVPELLAEISYETGIWNAQTYVTGLQIQAMGRRGVEALENIWEAYKDGLITAEQLQQALTSVWDFQILALYVAKLREAKEELEKTDVVATQLVYTIRGIGAQVIDTYLDIAESAGKSAEEQREIWERLHRSIRRQMIHFVYEALTTNAQATISFLKSAAAAIVSAIASLIQWCVRVMGPAGVAVAMFSAAGIYALYMRYKNMLMGTRHTGGYIEHSGMYELERGEYVVRKEVVEHIGLPALEQLNMEYPVGGHEIVYQPQVVVSGQVDTEAILRALELDRYEFKKFIQKELRRR